MKIDLTKLVNNTDDSILFNDKHRAMKNYKLMQWAKVATFGLYIVAVFMLYVSDVWGISSFLEKNSNEFVALGVFSVISFVLAYFLASSKEAVYEDIAIHRSEGYKLKPTQYAAMALFLSSGILFEMFSTTNNQQHIANAAAEQSSMMQSVQGTNVSILGSSGLTDSYAKASTRLASCQKKVAEGKGKDCVESQANLDAVKESMQMSNQLAQDASKASMDNKVDGMLKIREHFDKPMFQAIGKATGTDNNSGMLMVIGVLIFIFECQHIMALFAYANALLRLNRSKGKAAKEPASTHTPANAYQSPMGQVSPPLSAFNAAKMTVGEYAEKMEAGLKASPEIIATEYARAQHGHNQAMETFQNIAGNVGNKLDGLNKTYRQELNSGESVYSDSPLDKPRPALTKMSVEATVKQIQASVKASGANSPSAITAAVFDAFAAIPNPAPLNDTILERIADKLTPTSAPVAALVPFNQKPGLTGIHSPVLGTEEEHYALHLPVTESRDRPLPRAPSPVTGHGESVTAVTAVTASVMDEEKTEMLEKMAELEQKLCYQKAEMEAQASRDLEDRSRMKANAQAKLEAEQAEKVRAEQAQLERDRLRDLENRSRAEEAEKQARSREAEIRSRAEAAAEQAARDLEAAEQAARDLAERGSVTDEQIEIATNVIRDAIVSGLIQKVGSPQTSPVMKAEGLPTSNDTLKTLSKFACKQLETEGLVKINPSKGVGQPLYLIA